MRSTGAGKAREASECLFEVIPVGINLESLGALASLSQSTHLCGHVKHVVVSALRFREHGVDAAYLADVKQRLEKVPFKPDIVKERLKEFKSAYCACIKEQRSLQKGGLDLEILIKAFRGLVNLERVTYDRSNDNIGFPRIINNFGVMLLLCNDLVVFDDLYTLPTLVRALSESKTKVTDLHIGCRYDIFRPRCGTQNIVDVNRLTANALIAAFGHPDMCAHASQVMSEVQILEIEETDVEDNRIDLLNMAAAIKSMTNCSPKLKRIKVGEICSFNHFSNMQLLSIEDLFELRSAYHLQQLELTHLKIPDCRTIVAFLRHHAGTLIYAELIFVDLMFERWSHVLDQLREFDCPSLGWFDTHYCHDFESKELEDMDAVNEMRVHQYILRQTERNPRVLPYVYE